MIYTSLFLGQGDPLMVKVNKLTSTKTQLPYSYYSLPYCSPDKIVDSAENLGEVLRGDRIENSLFEVSFLYLMFFSCFFFVPAFFGGLCWVASMQLSYALNKGEFVLTRQCVMQFHMREPQMCHVWCHIVLNAKTAKELKEKIEDEYRVNM